MVLRAVLMGSKAPGSSEYNEICKRLKLKMNGLAGRIARELEFNDS